MVCGASGEFVLSGLVLVQSWHECAFLISLAIVQFFFVLDPIHELCSLSGIQLSENNFTYRLVFIFKSSKEDQMLQDLIMQYWFYFWTWLSRSFLTDQNRQVKIICTSQLPAPEGQTGGAGP